MYVIKNITMSQLADASLMHHINWYPACAAQASLLHQYSLSDPMLESIFMHAPMCVCVHALCGCACKFMHAVSLSCLYVYLWALGLLCAEIEFFIIQQHKSTRWVVWFMNDNFCAWVPVCTAGFFSSAVMAAVFAQRPGATVVIKHIDYYHKKQPQFVCPFLMKSYAWEREKEKKKNYILYPEGGVQHPLLWLIVPLANESPTELGG